jgi:hypothetical protein
MFSYARHWLKLRVQLPGQFATLLLWEGQRLFVLRVKGSSDDAGQKSKQQNIARNDRGHPEHYDGHDWIRHMENRCQPDRAFD